MNNGSGVNYFLVLCSSLFVLLKLSNCEWQFLLCASRLKVHSCKTNSFTIQHASVLLSPMQIGKYQLSMANQIVVGHESDWWVYCLTHCYNAQPDWWGVHCSMHHTDSWARPQEIVYQELYMQAVGINQPLYPTSYPNKWQGCRGHSPSLFPPPPPPLFGTLASHMSPQSTPLPITPCTPPFLGTSFPPPPKVEE